MMRDDRSPEEVVLDRFGGDGPIRRDRGGRDGEGLVKPPRSQAHPILSAAEAGQAEEAG